MYDFRNSLFPYFTTDIRYDIHSFVSNLSVEGGEGDGGGSVLQRHFYDFWPC